MDDPKVLALFVTALRLESQKSGIAANNAFVLVEWCCLLFKTLAGNPLYDNFGLDIVNANAAALEKCFQPPARPSVGHSALVITRRGLRAAFWQKEFRPKAIEETIQALTAKGAQPTARNAVMLGIVAGVCSRHEQAKATFANKKGDYFTYITREIIGSRTAPAPHIIDGLSDFFSDFVTSDDLTKDIVPPLEKGLLRAPEVVLDIVPAIVKPLSNDIDLSAILANNLMKPFLSNAKSSNAAIRQGVLNTFKVIVIQSQDTSILEKVADEILSPLKSGKLASPDHRLLHAAMLLSIPLSSPTADKVITAIPPVALKEGNEAALAAEVAAIGKSVSYKLQEGSELAKAITDAFAKGLSDKKINTRRIWVLKTGDILSSFATEPVPDNVAKFAEAVASPLCDTWSEILKNPSAAVQNTLITGAYVFATLAYQSLSKIDSPAVKTILKKASVSKETLVYDPKPSFLLNHRVYGRLTTEDDLQWFLCALAASVVDLPASTPVVRSAWSQAFVYLSSSPTVPSHIRKEACGTLSKLYAKNPTIIAEAVIAGIWQWVVSIENADKDSIASSAKFDKTHLHVTLRSICLNKEELTRMGVEQDLELLERQMCSLLVLSRPDLIPRSSWIDTVLRVGLDPGSLALRHEQDLLGEIIQRTTFDQVGMA